MKVKSLVFFSAFKNGFNAFPCFCSHKGLETTKESLTKATALAKYVNKSFMCKFRKNGTVPITIIDHLSCHYISGLGHEVLLELTAHKEKLLREKIVLFDENNKENTVTLNIHARVLGTFCPVDKYNRLCWFSPIILKHYSGSIFIHSRRHVCIKLESLFCDEKFEFLLCSMIILEKVHPRSNPLSSQIYFCYKFYFQIQEKAKEPLHWRMESGA